MKKLYLLFYFACSCLLLNFAFAAEINFSDFEKFQHQCTKKQLEHKLQHYLVRDSSLAEYYSLDEENFKLYATPENKRIDLPEYTLHLVTAGVSSKLAKTEEHEKTLRGKKIALDPGHFGGEYGELEERFTRFTIKQGFTEEAISFNEGDLALATAKVLRSYLVAEGADVLLTREEIGKGAIAEGFEDWLKQRYTSDEMEKFLAKPLEERREIFRKQYNLLDLRKRAEKINVFRPDLTLIIHYNTHTDNPKDQAQHPTKINYTLAFVPGSFMQNELSSAENRYEFVRLLVTNEVEESVKFSKEVLHELQIKLRTPLYNAEDVETKFSKACLKVDKGVYARNLLLTRSVKGPICYIEPLCQNHYMECVNLNRKDFEVEGIHTSKRVQEIAKVYFKAIKNYLKVN